MRSNGSAVGAKGAGRSPSPSGFDSSPIWAGLTAFIFMVFGALLVVGALAPGTTLGPAFSRGRGPQWPITRIGRACLLVAGVLLAVEGYRQGVRHEPPLQIPLRR